MAKPNGMSVTDVPCSCGWLERVTHGPGVPIRYDPEVNEYHIVPSGQKTGYLCIYHCPFCGGTAPKSKREDLFFFVSEAETQRLFAMAKDLKSLEDVVRRFGKPDYDQDAARTETPARDETPPRIEFHRTYRYGSLSETAWVDFLEDVQGRVHVVLLAKYKGKTPS